MKRLLALIMASCMLLALLTACGNSSSPSETGSQAPQSSAPQSSAPVADGSPISDELKDQMARRMEANPSEVYWLEGVAQLGKWYFDAIDPEQDFYFDGQGHLVIPFDKYEVGPGSTGSPEFTLLSPELYEQLLFRRIIPAAVAQRRFINTF